MQLLVLNRAQGMRARGMRDNVALLQYKIFAYRKNRSMGRPRSPTGPRRLRRSPKWLVLIVVAALCFMCYKLMPSYQTASDNDLDDLDRSPAVRGSIKQYPFKPFDPLPDVPWRSGDSTGNLAAAEEVIKLSKWLKDGKKLGWCNSLLAKETDCRPVTCMVSPVTGESIDLAHKWVIIITCA